MTGYKSETAYIVRCRIMAFVMGVIVTCMPLLATGFLKSFLVTGGTRIALLVISVSTGVWSTMLLFRLPERIMRKISEKNLVRARMQGYCIGQVLWNGVFLGIAVFCNFIASKIVGRPVALPFLIVFGLLATAVGWGGNKKIDSFGDLI